jgi:hypothetical protein
MQTEHDRVQELLAARALRAMPDEEYEAAEPSIQAHVRTCAECAAALQDFDMVAAELALATPSLRPPASLAHRIQRGLGPGRRTRRIGTVAAAAVVVLAMGLGAWSVHLTGRISRAERQQAQTAELISAVTVPDSKIVQLSPTRAAGAPAVAAVYVPARARLYLVGNMPAPGSNRVYQVWLRHQGQFASGGIFTPGPRGLVLVQVEAPGTRLDHVLITEEAGEGGTRPSAVKVAESDL